MYSTYFVQYFADKYKNTLLSKLRTLKRICICFFGLRFTNETMEFGVFDLTLSYSSEGSAAPALFRHH
jgi:hypothetical protein